MRLFFADTLLKMWVWQHFLLFVTHRFALFTLDVVTLRFAKSYNPLPSNKHSQNALDTFYLVVNSLIEHIFMIKVYMFLVAQDARLCSSLALFQFYGLLWCDDALYTMLHRCLHTRIAYRWLHWHHHKQKHPFRGYRDAGNENPLEQMLALLAHLSALRMVHSVIGTGSQSLRISLSKL